MHTADPGTPQAHVEARRSRIIEMLDRDAAPVAVSEPLARDRIDHLLRDAQELYWNELAWEELTDEEKVSDGHLTDLVFPAFLAFVDGLLLDSSPRGVPEKPIPHPEVVEEILTFLAEQYAEATADLEEGADSERLVWARAMTGQLIDLVLYRLYRLTPAERDEVESAEA